MHVKWGPFNYFPERNVSVYILFLCFVCSSRIPHRYKICPSSPFWSRIFLKRFSVVSLKSRKKRQTSIFRTKIFRFIYITLLFHLFNEYTISIKKEVLPLLSELQFFKNDLTVVSLEKSDQPAQRYFPKRNISVYIFFLLFHTFNEYILSIKNTSQL